MLVILNGLGNINLGKISSKECNSKHAANMAEKEKKKPGWKPIFKDRWSYI